MSKPDHVDSLPEYQLIKRAVRNCRGKRLRDPKWVAVMETFGLGSTYARQLCVKYGVDPDGPCKPRV